MSMAFAKPFNRTSMELKHGSSDDKDAPALKLLIEPVWN